MKMHSKVVLIIRNGLSVNWQYYKSLYIPLQDTGIKIKSTPQKRLWVTSYEDWSRVATTLSWVDPAIFAALQLNRYHLYFTTLSGKSLDLYFLCETDFNRKPMTWKWQSILFPTPFILVTVHIQSADNRMNDADWNCNRIAKVILI